jgi:beta propeller repeat protein
MWADISGDRIVWADLRNGNFDIYMYDGATGTESPITTAVNSQTFPAISGDRIVWRDERRGFGNYDIYMYDLATGTETPIATYGSASNFVDISGDRIVYADERNGKACVRFSTRQRRRSPGATTRRPCDRSPGSSTRFRG